MPVSPISALVPRARGFASLLVGAFLLVATAAWLGCSGDPSGASDQPNIVLVVVDSLRADRLGVYGARRPTSPSLDAFAAKPGSIVFERAYSTSSWTQPSVASILSGQMPSAHGLQRIGDQLSDEVPTLAEELGRVGYASAGVVSHLLLGERFGFARGFDSFDAEEARGHAHVSTGGVTDRAIAALERFQRDPGRPFFLLVHYFDPHYSYVDHADSAFAKPGEGRVRGGETINEIAGLLPSMNKREIATLRALYDEEIRETDRGFGRLLGAIQRLGIASDTVVVFTADHGEEFLDHGFIGHTYTLYEEVVRVPLVAHVPMRFASAAGRRATAGRGEPERVPRPVSVVGLAPWIARIAGLADGVFAPTGSSLAAALGSDGGEDEALLVEVDYVEWAPPGRAGELPRASSRTRKRALIVGDQKLVRDEESGRLELYDLAADPYEQKDLAIEAPDRARALSAQLDREREARAPEGAAGAVDLEPDEKAALRALGYAAP